MQDRSTQKTCHHLFFFWERKTCCRRLLGQCLRKQKGITGLLGFVQASTPTVQLHRGRSQLKNDPGAHSIEYKGAYTFLKEIYENFETGINKFLLYPGARGPGKVNVASPLNSIIVTCCQFARRHCR